MANGDYVAFPCFAYSERLILVRLVGCIVEYIVVTIVLASHDAFMWITQIKVVAWDEMRVITLSSAVSVAIGWRIVVLLV